MKKIIVELLENNEIFKKIVMVCVLSIPIILWLLASILASKI
jgi:hypothetical protein